MHSSIVFKVIFESIVISTGVHTAANFFPFVSVDVNSSSHTLKNSLQW